MKSIIPDNLSSSILTNNGTALNAHGHALVATTLMEELGLNQGITSDDTADNILVAKQRDALKRRQERVRIREFDLKQSGIHSTIVSAI